MKHDKESVIGRTGAGVFQVLGPTSAKALRQVYLENRKQAAVATAEFNPCTPFFLINKEAIQKDALTCSRSPFANFSLLSLSSCTRKGN